MRIYRKKPVEVEAVQWDGTNGEAIKEWGAGFRKIEYALTPPVLRIYTLEGTMEASLGDWVIKGIQGELYPCKPDIFKATYELVEETP